MPRYFMRETPLAGLEKMMMTPPTHRPRGGGLHIQSHQYTASDCDCQYCLKAEKETRVCQTAADCDCFAERLAAGCWTHGELAECLAREIAVQRLTDRTRRLMPPQMPNPFVSRAHQQRMTSIAAAMNREPSPYTAAAFLLSADTVLWKKSCCALCGRAVDFGKIDVRGISQDGYTLLQTAKDLYHGGCRITTEELCDSGMISDSLFRLIISAFVIRRYGLFAGAYLSGQINREG